MITAEEYRKKYPMQTLRLHDSDFSFRYYKNERAEETVVLLTGGIGFSDLLYVHFDALAKDFSVITFDYQEQYGSLRALADAAAELFSKLGVKVWLAGQSLGGVEAQIIAKYHPEVTKGLVLSNTCTMYEHMSAEARSFLEKMGEGQKKARLMLKILPFSLYKKLTAFLIKRMAPKRNALAEEITAMVPRLMTPSYEAHMISMILDTENYDGMTKADFEPYRGRVLLMLSEDDDVFSGAVRDALVEVMPDPQVDGSIRGGHLALLLQWEKYTEIAGSFIKKCSEQK